MAQLNDKMTQSKNAQKTYVGISLKDITRRWPKQVHENALVTNAREMQIKATVRYSPSHQSEWPSQVWRRETLLQSVAVQIGSATVETEWSFLKTYKESYHVISNHS